MPCWLLAFLYTQSIGCETGLLAARGLILAIETSYSKLTLKEHEQKMQVEKDISSVPSTVITHTSLSQTNLISTTWTLFKVFFGNGSLADLRLSEIVLTKNSYLYIAFMFWSVNAISYLVLIIASPAIRSCYNCEVFLEIAITGVRFINLSELRVLTILFSCV